MILFVQAVGGAQQPKPDASIERARQLWELAVAAKGGRENLYRVKGFAITDSRSGYPQASLFVFPDKNFYWSDARPTVFGFHASVINFEKNIRIFVPGDDPNDVRVGPPNPDLRSVFRDVSIRYFLETPWLKPEPVGAAEEKLGSRTCDVVTVKYERLLYKIYLDKATHLPARISAYAADKPDVELQLLRHDFSDYKEFDGVMMPQVESVNRQKPFRQSFEINPAYDPAVFERVPDMKAGADQWRAKRLKSVRVGAAASSLEEKFTQEEIREAINKLADSDENIWQEGQRLLWRAGRGALPQLIPAMTKARGALQMGLAKLVIDADLENDEALAVLRNLVMDKNEDPLTRQYAAFPLIRSDKGIAMLIEFLRDQDTLVRRIAIFACDDLTEQNEIPASFKPAIPILKKLLKDQDQIVREMAEEVLGQSIHRLKR
ncbi:MAG TPA: HEAT repeat domain-containing protein [Blastocatellia bacterium]|nr:HEAT repeat domain-containing protein [Blastocatellia bacterium]